jgi:hypothetical protein
MNEPGWNIEKLVTVAVFPSPWEARLAQSSLESEGVEAVIADENVGSLYGGGVVGGVKLRVREEDAAHATELLATLRPIPEIYLVTEEDARRPRCPTCRSEDIWYERWSRLGFLGSWILLGLPLPVPSRRWTCRSCGAEWREAPDQKETAPGVEGAAPDLVTVARFRTPWEAHLARTLLESEEIESCVVEDRFPPIDLLTGMPLALNRLEVHPEDAARALELLQSIDEQELSASET